MAKANDPEQICTIRIELTHSEPLIWREVEAPISITLGDLHEIIQIAIGWDGDHLWQFTIGKQTYGPDGDFDIWSGQETNAGEVALSEVLRPRRTTFRYLYDFGDSWEHKVLVTKIRAREPGIAYPRYIGGERNGPPEDCGGLHGYYEGLEAAAKNDDDDAAGDDWDEYSWAENFDPNDVDAKGIEAALRRMADHLGARKRPRRQRSKGADIAPFGRNATMADTVAMMVNALRAATPPGANKFRSANKK